MTVTAIVRIPVDNEELVRFEAEHPVETQALADGMKKWGKTHHRIASPGLVVEIERFATIEDFNSFWEETKDAIEAWETALGKATEFEIFEDLFEPEDVSEWRATK